MRMENRLLMRSFYKEFSGECSDDFPDGASPNKQIGFLKDHMISYWNGLAEIIFAAWLDGIEPYEFLKAGKFAYKKYQADQRAAREEQVNPF